MIKKLLQYCNLYYKSAMGSNFDLETFLSIKDPEEVFQYAEDNLYNTEGNFKDEEDYGSARAAFKLNGKALKIALPNNLSQGIHQNKSEEKLSKMLEGITTKVFTHHPNHLWILVELARPLSNQSELLEALNLSSPLDLNHLFGKFPPKNHKLKKEPNKTALVVSDLVKERILPRDVLKSDSWGYTVGPNPRLVLIDYGMLEQSK